MADSGDSMISSTPPQMISSEYDKVIFHNVADNYQTDADVECHYTVTSTLIPEAGDRVGLFKVGWKAPHQCITFEWAPHIPDQIVGSNSSVLFKAHDLPKSDGEYYQFCYISTENVVKGASGPFHFKALDTDDLIELEDDDLLIVRSRTAVTQEKLRDFELKNSDLLKCKITLEEELIQQNKRIASLEHTLKNKEETINVLRQELVEMKAEHEEQMKSVTLKLAVWVDSSTKQKEVSNKIYIQKELIIQELQENMKSLLQQKNHLYSTLTAEKKEAELLKKQLGSQDGQLKSCDAKTESITRELHAQQETVMYLQQQIRNLDANCVQEQKKSVELQKQKKDTEAERNHILGVLADTQHMLAAMEKSKHMATEELVKHTKDKVELSKSLETTVAELVNCKSLIQNLEEKQKTGLLELYKTNAEKLSLQDQHDTLMASHTGILEKQLLEVDKANVEKLVLQDQHDTLVVSHTEILQKQKQLEIEKESLTAVANDLRDRLTTGANEYQAKYMECLKLETKLGKLKKKCKVSTKVSIKIPPNCISPGYKFAKQTIPAIWCVSNVEEVYVTNIVNPFRFWLQLSNDTVNAAREQLVIDLQTTYAGKGQTDKYAIPPDNVVIGAVCAAMYEFGMTWRRAVIKSIISATQVSVYYVDYGITATIPKSYLRLLKQEFTALPTQAFLAKLAYIQPYKSETWSDKASEQLVQLVKWRTLSALLVEVGMDERKKEQLSIVLVSETNDKVVNKLLVDDKLAESTLFATQSTNTNALPVVWWHTNSIPKVEEICRRNSEADHSDKPENIEVHPPQAIKTTADKAQSPTHVNRSRQISKDMLFMKMHERKEEQRETTQDKEEIIQASSLSSMAGSPNRREYSKGLIRVVHQDVPRRELQHRMGHYYQQLRASVNSQAVGAGLQNKTASRITGQSQVIKRILPQFPYRYYTHRGRYKPAARQFAASGGQYASSAAGQSVLLNAGASGALPPPMLPEITTEAKLAAISAFFARAGPQEPAAFQTRSSESDDSSGSDYVTSDGPRNQHETAVTASAPSEDSTKSDDPRSCPICDAIFIDDTEIAILEHVESHYDLTCPICGACFPQEQLKELEQHTDMHFQEPIETNEAEYYNYHLDID